MCNYPETVTLTSLPTFVTHNKASSDFLIPKNNDLSLLGKYVVKIRSEICVPEDYTKATCSLMFVEYQFTVEVLKCIVNTYTATQKVGDLRYNVGAASLLNVGAYKFDESPVCNYPETVTLTSLPVFVTHKLPTSNFDIPKTIDLSLIGSYVVTIRSEI